MKTTCPNLQLFYTYVCSNTQYFLCLQSIKNHGFDSHFYANRVEPEDIFFCMNVESLVTGYTSYLCKNNEKIFLLIGFELIFDNKLICNTINNM